MKNLIVTIILIALVAIVAIMGVYYGGVAFETAQMQALANKIDNDLAQIQAAAVLYEETTGTTDFGSSPQCSPAFSSSSTYITQWPSFPA